jgi:hypothetical protein
LTGAPDLEAVESAAVERGERIGWLAACRWFVVLLNAELAAVPPYTDTRPLESLRSQAEDKIRTMEGG